MMDRVILARCVLFCACLSFFKHNIIQDLGGEIKTIFMEFLMGFMS